jgi:poly-beta-1,6-N-acetyl-D-glucosamine synthase
MAILYRFFFITTVDVAKLCATVEEFLNVKMSWGKLQRAGRI